ncbi:MAG: DUF5076 domain-containing protein [Dehalococcoidia bacterium]|nr:DUF5076 domain-containing protein [Dehalococcoidia bacterium]
MGEVKELAPPAGIHAASRAMELARIWIVDNKQQVSLSGNLWDDPAAWGLMLVDLARHVSKAYENQGRDKEEVLGRILRAFDAERGHPTDDPEQLL